MTSTRRGRPAGSGARFTSREHLHTELRQAYAWAAHRRRPSRQAVADRLGIALRTLTRALVRYQQPWPPA